MPVRIDRHVGVALTLLAFGGAVASAQAAKPLPLKHKPEPTTPAITAADLMTRLYIYADDSMMGRKAGTPDNNRATDYIASELKKAGLQPGGENGTYFQSVPIIHSNMSLTKAVIADGKRYLPTKDYIPRLPKQFNGAQAIYGGLFGSDAMIAPDQAAGKVVILSVPKGADGKLQWAGTRQPSTTRYRNAAAIAIAGMDGMAPSDWTPLMEEGFDILNDPTNPTDVATLLPPGAFMYVTVAMAEGMLGAPLAGMKPGTIGKAITGGMGFDSTYVTARNVIGIIPGSDPKLKGQYVAMGAHNDHVGTTHVVADHDSVKMLNSLALPAGADSTYREMTPDMVTAFQKGLAELRAKNPPRPDSIFNGADDDGSGTVSALEIAEAFAKSATKPKRSLIFVWHTGEELGLFGSQYFTDHPTIPRDSIVAQLNMDMIGRGSANDVTGKTSIQDSLGAGPPKLDFRGQPLEGLEIHGNPDYVQLVGSRRLSTELGNLIESVNARSAKPLKFDYSIDASGHPSQIYCRSDHYSYARYGIPITFLTTGGHSDYHQLTDEPQYIDYDHMARVATLVMDAATAIANLDHRIVVDKPKPDPKAICRQ